MAFANGALGQSSSTKVRIEPYTGPPIFLEEPEPAIPPRPVENTVSKQLYENGNPHVERGVTRFSDNSIKNHGEYREYYEDGQKYAEGQYDTGTPVGEWTFWHANGQLAKKVTYKDGKPHGTVELFRADGTLQAKREYAEGLRHGTWQVYDESGEQLLREYSYRDGKGDGKWKWWYPSGQLLRETTFVGGLMDGVATEWAEDGAKRAVMPFKEGKRHGMATQWMADGSKIEQMYEMGKPVEKPGS